MRLDLDSLQKVRRQLEEARRVLVISHTRPDGDAIGSVLGLGPALTSAGKQVHMILADGVPGNFQHLEGSSQVRHYPSGEYDTICVVDCSDLERTGKVLNGYGQPDINIDHHITNLNYAKINLVDSKAVSTTEILVEILPVLGLSLDHSVAAALLTGLITDTIGFRTSNMTPKALRLAADLTEMGLDLPDLYRRALVARSLGEARLWGVGLSQLEYLEGIVWTSITLEDRRQIGYAGLDDADLVNVLSDIDSVDIALIFLEQPNERVKVSWRSQPGFDVSQVALGFGGGGHPNASGAEIQGAIEDVRSAVLEATRPIIMEKVLASNISR